MLYNVVVIPSYTLQFPHLVKILIKRSQNKFICGTII